MLRARESEETFETTNGTTSITAANRATKWKLNLGVMRLAHTSSFTDLR